MGYKSEDTQNTTNARTRALQSYLSTPVFTGKAGNGFAIGSCNPISKKHLPTTFSIYF